MVIVPVWIISFLFSLLMYICIEQWFKLNHRLCTWMSAHCHHGPECVDASSCWLDPMRFTFTNCKLGRLELVSDELGLLVCCISNGLFKVARFMSMVFAARRDLDCHCVGDDAVWYAYWSSANVQFSFSHFRSRCIQSPAPPSHPTFRLALNPCMLSMVIFLGIGNQIALLNPQP